jgi:hypothetical protein
MRPERSNCVRQAVFVLMAVVSLASSAGYTVSAFGPTDGRAVTITEVKMPAGFHDWRQNSVAHEEGKINELRARQGNRPAIKVIREGKLRYPGGTNFALRYDALSGGE